jgi:hypothetical protein
MSINFNASYPCFEQHIGDALSQTYMRMSNNPNSFNAGCKIFNTSEKLINFFVLQSDERDISR